MHYDSEHGVKDNTGLFPKMTVLVLLVLVAATGLYLTLDWFAPEIFSKTAVEKQQIEDTARTTPPDENYRILRVPVAGIEREIVDKNTEDKIQLTQVANRIVLSGKARTLGVTPLETLRLSPLAGLGTVQVGSQIFVDLDGVRWAYKATALDQNVKPDASPQSDLTIYALSDDGKTAAVRVLAEKVGEVKIP
jgi:hypothetical protein